MMPVLRHASDIMTAYWLRNNPNPKGLKYYFALGIQNNETNRVIASILLDKEIYDMPRWPGVKLNLASGYWGFSALLGSPIGSTTAHILLEHKPELGIKHITEIMIFQYDEMPQGESANDESDPPDDEEDPEDEEMDEEDEGEVVVHLLFKIRSAVADMACIVNAQCPTVTVLSLKECRELGPAVQLNSERTTLMGHKRLSIFFRSSGCHTTPTHSGRDMDSPQQQAITQPTSTTMI